MTEYIAICRDCEWDQSMPKREMAEHAKRIHEDQYDHTVIVKS